MFTRLIILTFFIALSSGSDSPVVNPLTFKPTSRVLTMPHRPPGEPLKISLSAHVLHFNVNTGKQEFDLIMYFRQEWKDDRLTYKSSDPSGYRVIDHPYFIWMPDLFFLNDVTTYPANHSRSNSLVHLYPDGKIFTSQRLHVKAVCSMDLMSYPFDTQKCELVIESLSFTANDLITEWNRSSVAPVTGVADASGFQTKIKWHSTIIEFKGNEYGRSAIEFHMKRNPTSITIHVILPIAVLVICSWVSFFFNRKLMLLRLILCLLPIITQLLLLSFGGVFTSLPASLTGLDIWISFCFLSMFGAFFECIYILCLSERSISKRPYETDPVLLARSQKIDYRARIAFACSFVTFNVFCVVFVCLSDDF